MKKSLKRSNSSYIKQLSTNIDQIQQMFSNNKFLRTQDNDSPKVKETKNRKNDFLKKIKSKNSFSQKNFDETISKFQLKSTIKNNSNENSFSKQIDT